jgi:hypothetical protein
MAGSIGKGLAIGDDPGFLVGGGVGWNHDATLDPIRLSEPVFARERGDDTMGSGQ